MNELSIEENLFIYRIH